MHKPLCYHPLAWAAFVASGSAVFSTDALAVYGPPASGESRVDDRGGVDSEGLRVGSATPSPEAGATGVGKLNVAQSIALAEVEFNPAFFTGNVADLSRYTRGNPVAPGTYPVDVSVNGEARGRFDVVFEAVPGSDIAMPCFTVSGLERLGVDVERVLQRSKGLGREVEGALPPTTCVALAQAVPGSTAALDTADLTLDLSVPQLEMNKRPRGYVDPSRWDDGINAGLLQYSLSTYSSHQSPSGDFNSVYLGLQSGINVGGWRLRQWSTANWQNRAAGMHWQSVALYAQHDITALRSQFTIGDSSTNGQVFDTFNVRGVQLSSDDRMLPDSAVAYAPVVRGVADTNARVTVRQANNILYETSVPPGPFELTDLPATGYSGDIEVTVTEADARVKRFLVPFAAVPQLLRPGMSRFNVTAGQYRDTTLSTQPWVAQATYQHGFTNLLTAYAGVLGSDGYASGLLGVALNTPVGAFAFDVTTAHTDLPNGGKGQGYSARASYNKVLPTVKTNFAVAAYRYSTASFYSLQDAVYARYGTSRTSNGSPYNSRSRNRVQLSITQPFGEGSSVYVTGTSQDYWGGRRGYDLQYQIGLSSAFKRVGYSVYAQRTRMQNSQFNTQVGLNLTIPLGGNSAVKRNIFDSLTTNLTRSSGGDSTIQANASGSTAGVTPINYGVTASRIGASGSRNETIGGYGMYRAPYGTFDGNASVGNQSRQAAVNANGAVVVHSGGVTLSPPLGTAFALVEAKGAQGGTLINGQGATIDRNGYAVIPSLMPYRVNAVALDPSGVSLDVDLHSTSEEVVPRLNSLVKVKLATSQGKATFATLEKSDGKSLPMGTELFDASGNSVGVVGQGGMALLRGLEGNGNLTAKWGTQSGDQCVMPYAIPQGNTKTGNLSMVTHVQLNCELSPDAQR